MKLDVTKMCAAKSDQINAIDLISGPRIAKITDVKIFSETDQPIHVVLDGDSKRPWKCSKTSVRVLAALYSNDASKWIGKHIEIYCDETVLWGGQPVGGVRQSKAEGIASPKRLSLTKSRTKKETVVINPLSEDEIKSHYGKSGNPGQDRGDQTAAGSNKATQDAAREAAKKGKAAFTDWWKSVDGNVRDAVKPIMDELKRLSDEADAT